jgi:dephospho-CoA kinase
MGKSTAAAMLRRMGVPVHDADAVVHALSRPGGAALPAIRAAFPDLALADGGIDRAALSKRAFADPAALRRLETILHPLVRAAERKFLRLQRARRCRVVVLDIPLLFETGGEQRCDAVLVVSAPRLVQVQRALARPGMSAEKFAAIEGKQMPDAEKRRRADCVIPTGRGKRATWVALRRAVRAMRSGYPGA